MQFIPFNVLFIDAIYNQIESNCFMINQKYYEINIRYWDSLFL